MTPPPRLLSRVAVVSGCALLFIGTTALAARPAKKSRNADGDSPPVLISQTGGGNSWADVRELTAAAEKGNPIAEAQLGEMLLRGDSTHKVPQDRARAMQLLESAARKGEGSAAFRIGMILDQGIGVPQDRSRALAYFRAAAAGGVGEAFHNIGAAYAGAKGVRLDYAEGLAWLILARKHGLKSPAESALRDQIQKVRRPELAQLAEKRVPEIERELAGKTVTEHLPPPAGALTSNTPAGSRKSSSAATGNP
ncbi:MAG: tetratricopeptide repeat protein [Opitutus sp.]